MSTLALFLAVTGGTAYATHLAVNSSDVVDESLTQADLRTGSVGSTELAPSSVLGGHVRDGTLGTADVATGSLNGSDLLDGSLNGSDVADESLTGRDITNGSVTKDDLGTDSVGWNELEYNNVNGTHIADGTVSGQDIKDGSVKQADVAPNFNAGQLDGKDSTAFQDRILFANVRDDGTLESSHGVLSVTRVDGGWYKVTFWRPLASSSALPLCSVQVTVRGGHGAWAVIAERVRSDPFTVDVRTGYVPNTDRADQSFSLAVLC